MLCIIHVLVLGRALQLEVTVPELQHGFLRAQPGASLPCQTQASPGERQGWLWITESQKAGVFSEKLPLHPWKRPKPGWTGLGAPWDSGEVSLPRPIPRDEL